MTMLHRLLFRARTDSAGPDHDDAARARRIAELRQLLAEISAPPLQARDARCAGHDAKRREERCCA
jgi:hypothetical protein